MEEISTMNSVEKEMFNLEDNSSGAGDTSDRFERLNLFFDKNQVGKIVLQSVLEKLLTLISYLNRCQWRS